MEKLHISYCVAFRILYKKLFQFNYSVTVVKQISVIIEDEIDPLLKIYSFLKRS